MSEQNKPLTCTILPVKTWAERPGDYSSTMCVYRQHEGEAPFLLAEIHYDQAHIDNAGQHRIAQRIMGQDPEIAALRAQVEALTSERNSLKAIQKNEADATDFLLKFAGIDQESVTTEGGVINVGKLRIRLDELVELGDWRPIETAPKDGVFQVYLDEEMLGSRVQTMNAHPNVSSVGGVFHFDAPRATHCPAVFRIDTYAGGKPDTMYLLRGRKWSAACQRDASLLFASYPAAKDRHDHTT